MALTFLQVLCLQVKFLNTFLPPVENVGKVLNSEISLLFVRAT